MYIGNTVVRHPIRHLTSLGKIPSAIIATCFQNYVTLNNMAEASMENSAQGKQPPVSQRIQDTDIPVMTMTRRMLAGVNGARSLAQGAVYWGPPPEVIQEVAAKAGQPVFSEYGSDEGTPELRTALLQKIRQQNKLEGYNVMVTAGANQGLATLMITPAGRRRPSCAFQALLLQCR
eukprot:jgi/Botrbrau1/19127/Bobra.0077s0039.1